MKLLLRLLSLVALVISAYLLVPKILEDNITIVSVYNKTSPIVGVGFFIDKKHILTVAHLVEPKGNQAVIGTMEILDEAGHKHPVRVVGVDTDSDIALLEFNSKCDTKPKIACSSRRLLVGDLYSREVFYSKNYGYSLLSVFSDPFNVLYPVYLKGEILGVDTSVIVPDAIYIMHDSSVIPGYSGSPLLDRNDCYVGMNVMVDIDRPKISMAVSAKTIKEVVPKLIKSGKIDMPFMGIVLEQTLNRVFISGAIKDSPADILSGKGVRILENFLEESPEQDPREIVIYPTHQLFAINNIRTNNFDEVWRILRSLPSGSNIKILIQYPSGNLEEIEIKSGERFSMMRKYIPLGRSLPSRYLLIV